MTTQRERTPNPATRIEPLRSRPQDRAASPSTTRVPANVQSFDPDKVRPWRFHNRAGSGMDALSIDALADSIKRNGQQQPGLARKLASGDTHSVEAIFGVRRLEACRRAGVHWQAEVRDASLSDTECAALMHGENAWTEGVSPLENAVQWQAMLDEGVFPTQSALAAEIGCHRGTVARAVRTSRALFAEEWLARLVRPVMHEFSGRAADRLADACANEIRREKARRRAERLSPGQVPANSLYDALFGLNHRQPAWQTVFVRRRGQGGGGGAVAARILRNDDGAWSVIVQAHEQTPSDQAELAEQIETLVRDQTTAGASVRLGRKLVDALSPEDASAAERLWLEGCVWAWARTTGLDWDRLRCAVAADILRKQPKGWQRAVVQAVESLDMGRD